MVKLIDFSLNRPLATLLVSISVTLIFLWGAVTDFEWQIPFRSDYKVFFKTQNPQLQEFLSMQQSFTKSDNLVFVVLPSSGEIFSKQSLEAMLALTQAAWQLPHSVRVDSVTNFQHSYAKGDTLVIEDLVSSAKLNQSGQSLLKTLADIKSVALSDPSIVNNLLSEEARVALVNVSFNLPENQMSQAVPEIVESARALQRQFERQFPHVKLQLTGVLVMNASFQEIAQWDAALRIPAMLLLVFLAIGIFLKSFSGAAATLFVIGLSLLSTMGIWGWVGGFITGPSTTAPVVILTLTVADCVHILSNYFQNLRQGELKRAALKHSLIMNFRPIALTSFTTGLGFLTMNFSDSPPFIGLGNLVAIGVFFAFVFSVTFFPAFLMLAPVPKVGVDSEKKVLFLGLSHWIIRHKKGLMLSTVMSIFLSSFLISLNELNDDFVRYFDDAVAFRQATETMQKNVRGITTLEIAIETNLSQGISEPEFIHFVENFANWLRTLKDMEHVLSLTDTLKRLNQNMHDDDPSFYQLPNDRELIAQYLLLYELSLPLGLDLNHQVNLDKSATRLIATFKSLTSKQILALEQQIQTHFQSLNSGYSLKMSSPSLMFAHIGSTNIISMIKGTLIAFTIISIVLALVFRSWHLTYISLLPNIAPVAIAFGLWGVFDGEVGLGLSVVMGVSLGIIVDNTIHFLYKYIQCRSTGNFSSEQAIVWCFSAVGRAILITSVVLTFGFLVMASSSLKVNADMGLLTAVTLVVAFVIDVLFLPPLLLYFYHAPSGNLSVNQKSLIFGLFQRAKRKAVILAESVKS